MLVTDICKAKNNEPSRLQINALRFPLCVLTPLIVNVTTQQILINKCVNWQLLLP